MKIAERIHWLDNDKTMVVETKQAIDPHLKAVADLREQGITGYGDNRLVARIPYFLFNEWLKEAGLRWDSETGDINAMLQRKINDPDFNKLRVTDGHVVL